MQKKTPLFQQADSKVQKQKISKGQKMLSQLHRPTSTTNQGM
jgi:hypothetical protein